MIAALIVATAQASASLFAPPIDRTIEATTIAERTESGVTRRFESTRTLRFAALPDGYRVAVTMTAAGAAEDAHDPAGLFRAGFASLAGRTVTLRLDRLGKVTQIEDEMIVWQAILDGMAKLAPKGDGPENRVGATRVRAIVAALRDQPPERRRAMLASLVAPLIAPDLVAEGRAAATAPRAVRVPAASIYGRAELDGLRTVRAGRAGVEVRVSATGRIAVTAPEGETTATITYETLRRIDPDSGLVIESREHVQTLAPDGAIASERTSVTRLLGLSDTSNDGD
ncbi:hypothetical protein FPZ54_11845 [Sphingomonas suaedae]|uniref:Uncharacterized protein n=1 Tax=Sphingomonas suaedae TaxID=2599297 RepID=A0A518RGU7_9SPHN|nr:hypothetical protein [Sphingomonas suaedae]QDX26644.1 hypothetical protein FPZ54_11845 [Sphingomonas suaedae]